MKWFQFHHTHTPILHFLIDPLQDVKDGGIGILCMHPVGALQFAMATMRTCYGLSPSYILKSINSVSNSLSRSRRACICVYSIKSKDYYVCNTLSLSESIYTCRAGDFVKR